MTILNAGDYGEVRAAIMTDLTADELKNEVISASVYQGAAELEVIAVDSEALERTDETEVTRVRMAAIYLTAARLCPAVANVISLRNANGSQTYNKAAFDPHLRAAELRQMGYSVLEELIPESESTVTRPVAFALARGQRGR